MHTTKHTTQVKTFKIIAVLVLAIALMVIMLQNDAPVQVRFLWMSGQMSTFLLLFLTATGGFAVGLLVALLTKRIRNKKKQG